MDFKPLVESVARELLEAWRTETAKPPSPPKVLYIFCDSTAHEAYGDHFIHLKNHGIGYDILFLDGETSAWLGMSKLECGCPGKIIAADEFAPAPIEVPAAYEGIVIPELDLDNAARITLGMKGTIKAEIAFSALVQGKFVLVGEDTSGLKRADRRTMSRLALPEPYAKLFDYYKHELRMYGVELGPQRRLAELVVGMLADSKASERAEEISRSSTASTIREEDAAERRVVFEGRLLSADWLESRLRQRPFSELAIARRTIVTPLAADGIKRHGISVTYADER